MTRKEPDYLIAARRDIGLREIKGPKHAGRIVQMLQRLGAWWRDDETPWCGVAVGAWLSETGHAIPKHYYRALAWSDYGYELQGPRQGAIAVMSRKGGGHVGIVTGVSPDGSHVRLIGGNQNDAVNEAWFPASRITAYRSTWERAAVGLPVACVDKVGALSTSEA